MKPKIVYDKVEIAIPIGQTNFNQFITLREGGCLGVKLIHKENTPANGEGVDIGVENSQNLDLISATDYRDFINEGAGYLGSLKPCDFESRGQVKVTGIATAAIAGTIFKAQLIFAIDTANCND